MADATEVAELSFRGGFPPPRDLPHGDCITTILADGTLRVDRADPRVMVSAELLAMVATGPHPCVTLTMLQPGPNGTPFFEGATLKIEGVNRTVIYVIREYIPAVHGYVAEWPD